MNLHYIAHHLLGAWKLLRGNEEGFDHFDLTEEGFWRSFLVLFFILPFLLVAVAAGYSILVEFTAQEETFKFSVPFPVYLIMEVVLTYGGWVAFLLVMAPISRMFGVAERYMTFVTSYNWANLLVVLLVFPFNSARLMGWISIEILSVLQVFLGLAFLAYAWFVATAALKISRLNAAAVVATEILIYLVLNRVVNIVYGLFPGTTA